MQKREGLWVLHIVVLCSNSTGVINLTYVKVKSLLLVLTLVCLGRICNLKSYLIFTLSFQDQNSHCETNIQPCSLCC